MYQYASYQQIIEILRGRWITNLLTLTQCLCKQHEMIEKNMLLNYKI